MVPRVPELMVTSSLVMPILIGPDDTSVTGIAVMLTLTSSTALFSIVSWPSTGILVKEMLPAIDPEADKVTPLPLIRFKLLVVFITIPLVPSDPPISVKDPPLNSNISPTDALYIVTDPLVVMVRLPLLVKSNISVALDVIILILENVSSLVTRVKVSPLVDSMVTVPVSPIDAGGNIIRHNEKTTESDLSGRGRISYVHVVKGVNQS